jgi:Migration and invasion-inhibitory
MAVRPYSKLLAGRDREGPLLGYDWIAGLMDNERSLTDIPDDCLEEVREFRRLNKDACVGSYDLL